MSTYYVAGTVQNFITHLILKTVLWLSSYLDHTYTDSDDADIQEVGLKP